MIRFFSVPLLAFAVIMCVSSCKKSDSGSSSYNGFKLDGVVYQADSIEHTFNTSLRPLKIHSKDHGGAAIYVRTMPSSFPSADGIYRFAVKAGWKDSMDVNLWFETDDHATEYDSIEGANGESLSTLTITISGGKWTVLLPTTAVYDNTMKTLEINASE